MANERLQLVKSKQDPLLLPNRATVKHRKGKFSGLSTVGLVCAELPVGKCFHLVAKAFLDDLLSF